MGEGIEFTDLLGLQKPIIKLIEVVADGIGTIYEPRRIRKEADARLYEIQVINSAIGIDASLSDLEYDNSCVKISKKLTDNDKEELMVRRLLSKESKKQQNVDKVIKVAYDELSIINDVSNEKVSEDWVSRFFKMTEDVSSEQMQVLWGKILAGEIEKPNSYSLRTLEVLRNLSKKEAELFNKVSRFAIKTDICTMIALNKAEFIRTIGVRFGDILLLDELGLLDSKVIAYELLRNETLARKEFIYGNKILVVERQPSPKVSIEMHKFTRCGEELIKLMPYVYTDDYVRTFARKLKTNKSSVTCYDILSNDINGIKYKTEGIEL